MRPLGYRGKMLPKTSEVTEEEKGLDRFYTYLSGWIDKIEQELMPTMRKREMVCLKKKNWVFQSEKNQLDIDITLVSQENYNLHKGDILLSCWNKTRCVLMGCLL